MIDGYEIKDVIICLNKMDEIDWDLKLYDKKVN